MSGETTLATTPSHARESKSPKSRSSGSTRSKWGRLAVGVGLLLLVTGITLGWMGYHRRVVVLACYRSDEAPPADLEPLQIPPAPIPDPDLNDDLGTLVDIHDAWIVELKVAAPLAFEGFVSPAAGRKPGFRYGITSGDFTLLDAAGDEFTPSLGQFQILGLPAYTDFVVTDLEQRPSLCPRVWIRVQAIFSYRGAERPWAIRFRDEPPVRLP